MTQNYCSDCGYQLEVGKSFCANCGVRVGGVTGLQNPASPFVAPPVAAPTTAPPAPAQRTTPATKRSSPLRPLLMIVGLVAVLGVGYVLLQGTADGILADVNSEIGSGVDHPPVGDIWFGSSFDVDTLEVSGRTRMVGASESFSFVGSLPRAMDADDLAIRASVDGEVVRFDAFNAEGSSDLWGFSYSPLFLPGTWTIEYTDIGGNVLATGELEVTE